MSNFAKKLVNNSFWLILGEVISKISTFIFLAIVARKIGVENFGKYNFALSFIMVITLFNDLGLTNYLFRELARNRDEKNKYVVNICVIRFATLVIFALAIAAYLKIPAFSRETSLLIYIFLGWFFVSSYLNIFRKIFRALEMMSADTLINIIDNVFRLLFAVILLKLGLGTNGVALAYVAGTLLAALLSIVIYVRNFGNFSFSFDYSLWKHAFGEMRFLAVSALFLGLFGFFDVLILSKYQGATAVGIFSASFKLVWMILMIPCLITEAAFPKLSQLAVKDNNKFGMLISYLLKTNVLMTSAIAITVFVFADKVIAIVYGYQYMQSVFVLRILIWYLVLYSVNIVFIYGLMAINKQMHNAILLGCTLIVNVVLDVVLAKKYGYIGISFAPIISAAMLFCVYMVYYSKIKCLTVEKLKLSRDDIEIIRAMFL